jgi:hypothetical protein
MLLNPKISKFVSLWPGRTISISTDGCGDPDGDVHCPEYHTGENVA